MTGFVVRLELRRSRVLFGWLAFVVLGYGATMASFYPVIRDNGRVLEEYLRVFPKPLLAAFGMEGSLADHGVFFNTYIGSMVWPIVAAIVGAILGTRPIAADLDRGFLELPLATRISRVRYLSAAIANQLLVIGGLSVATVAGVLAVGAVVKAGFDAGRFALAVPLLFAFASAVASVACLISVLTLSRGISAGIVAGVLILMYLLNAIAGLRPDLDWLGAISAFHYVRTISVIDDGVVPLAALAIFGVAAIAAWGTAVWAFRRRDLVA